MKQKIVVVEIDDQGNSSLDLQNFQGTGCDKAARDFIGNDTVKSDKKKAEYYQQQSVKQLAKQGAGK